MQGQGTFFDGQTASRHAVQVALSPDRQALLITGDTLPDALRWPLADLRALSEHTQTGDLVLTRHMDTDDESPRDPARLVLRDPALIDWIVKTRPSLRNSDLRRGTGRRILRNGALAMGALALMLLVILPGLAGTLARIMPVETEERFGRAAVGQMQRFLSFSGAQVQECTDPAGRAALDAMVARLMAGQGIPYDLKVLVFDHPMLNAFAAPGGYVVLIRGLIEQADGPDAVAAVLAHEIGHVANRDATRNALRAAGSAGILSLILGDVAGGAVLVAVADQMLNSAYSRRAEETADAYAIAMLNAADISTAGFGAFFDTLAGQEGGLSLPEYLSTHPATADRAANARANAEGQGATTPALTDRQWQALRQICG